jgi:hypothetical protein
MKRHIHYGLKAARSHSGWDRTCPASQPKSFGSRHHRVWPVHMAWCGHHRLTIDGNLTNLEEAL